MKNKGTLIGIVIFILTLGVGGYFWFGKNKKANDGGADNSPEQNQGGDFVEQPAGTADEYGVEPYISKWFLKRFSKEQFLQRIAKLASKPAWVEKQRTKAASSGQPLGKQMVASAYWYLKNRP